MPIGIWETELTAQEFRAECRLSRTVSVTIRANKQRLEIAARLDDPMGDVLSHVIRRPPRYSATWQQNTWIVPTGECDVLANEALKELLRKSEQTQAYIQTLLNERASR